MATISLSTFINSRHLLIRLRTVLFRTSLGLFSTSLAFDAEAATKEVHLLFPLLLSVSHTSNLHPILDSGNHEVASRWAIRLTGYCKTRQYWNSTNIAQFLSCVASTLSNMFDQTVLTPSHLASVVKQYVTDRVVELRSNGSLDVWRVQQTETIV